MSVIYSRLVTLTDIAHLHYNKHNSKKAGCKRDTHIASTSLLPSHNPDYKVHFQIQDIEKIFEFSFIIISTLNKYVRKKHLERD